MVLTALLILLAVNGVTGQDATKVYETSGTVTVGEEVVDDGVSNSKEQIVSKYTDFDWKTETPTRNDVVNAVTSAVGQYYSTENLQQRSEIVNDVSKMGVLYYSL